MDGRVVDTRPVVEPAASVASTRFESEIEPHIEVLYRVARSITHDPVEAEDLVQDTLLRAFRSIERFDGAHPRAWLMTILRNTHINRHRRRRPSLLNDPDTIDERVDLRSDLSSSVETEVLRRIADDRVVAAFEELSAPFREVVELVDLVGVSYAEAAETLGIPAGTVMSRLHRARRKVRESLDAAGYEWRSP